MMSVLAPVLAKSQSDRALLERRFARALYLIIMLALPVVVLGPLTAWRLLPELPGFGGFEGAGVALAIMAPGAAVILVGTVVQGALVSAHLQGLLLRVSLAGLAFNLAAIAVLIPWFSYVGAAVATTATELLTVGLSVILAHRRLGLKPPYARCRRLLPAAGLAAGAALLAAPLGVVLQLALALIAYVLGLLLARAVRREDLEGLPLPGMQPVR
jgi:O-antigen/teichoic acid export membrane protein